MELVEFHIGNPATGTISHRNPITGRDIWIGGIKIGFHRTATSQGSKWG
jgi:hypothetical protein